MDDLEPQVITNDIRTFMCMAKRVIRCNTTTTTLLCSVVVGPGLALLCLLARLRWARPCWTGPDWMDSAGLGSARLVSAGLDWLVLDSAGPGWHGLDSGLAWPSEHFWHLIFAL